MIEHKLRSGVNWQVKVKQKCERNGRKRMAFSSVALEGELAMFVLLRVFPLLSLLLLYCAFVYVVKSIKNVITRYTISESRLHICSKIMKNF